MQRYIDTSARHANPESPYVLPSAVGGVRRGYIQQHGEVAPNSQFNAYLDGDRVRYLGAHERMEINQRLPMSDNQPSSILARELLVPLGALQARYNADPTIGVVRVPNAIVRQGAVEYTPTPIEDVVGSEEIKQRILDIIQGDEKADFR